MLIIGLTGGIGSGKTTVASVFSSFGIPIYNSDVRAKHIMNTNADLIISIKELLGNEAYKNGLINKPYISNAIFNSKQLLAKINALVHPKVAEDFTSWSKEHSKFSFVIKESAILIESKAYKSVDKIIVVNAPVALRIKRVALRDNADEAAIKARMSNQINDNERNQYADYIINNNSEDSLILQVQKIIKKIEQSRS